MKTLATSALCLLIATSAAAESHGETVRVEYGARPDFLISQMDNSTLKDQLMACSSNTAQRSSFSIGHRGAPLLFPEHTVESNIAAAQQGAGILECDVTFTKDLELVCRHAQNDLHTTTNILASEFAQQCTTPFSPASGDTPASAECRTSDLT
ncbi:MAG: glycerophosphodiester phosphodiesterase family protein, partial [Pseudomonadota bacterium]